MAPKTARVVLLAIVCGLFGFGWYVKRTWDADRRQVYRDCLEFWKDNPEARKHCSE